jgi:hypothetical protein
MVVRDGINYVVNRDHPLASGLRDALGGREAVLLEQLLRTLELSLPTDSLYGDMASERRVQLSADGEEVEAFLQDLFDKMTHAAGSDPGAALRLAQSLVNIEPFSTYPTISRKIMERLRNGG